MHHHGQVSEGGPRAGVPLASPLLEYVLEGLQELGQELLQQLLGSLIALGLILLKSELGPMFHRSGRGKVVLDK